MIHPANVNNKAIHAVGENEVDWTVWTRQDDTDPHRFRSEVCDIHGATRVVGVRAGQIDFAIFTPLRTRRFVRWQGGWEHSHDKLNWAAINFGGNNEQAD